MFHKILLLLCICIAYIFLTNGEYALNKVEKPTANEFTHQVSIRINGEHFCGGTILDKYTILTSVTCVDGRIYYPFEIVAGTKSATSQGPTHKSTFKITNSEYNEKTGNNNLAIIKLSTPLEFNQHVTAATLPKTYSNYGQNITLAGWGWELPNTNPSEDMLYTKLPIQMLESCNGTLFGSHLVTNKQICVNPCEGEIWTGNTTNVLFDGDVLVGMSTWVSGANCTNKNSPDLYTGIYFYLDWINMHLSNDKTI